MKNLDIVKHVTGESAFIDDLLTPNGTLFAYVFDSRIAHGKIKKLNIDKAKSAPGVKGIFTYQDIPGENQIGNIVADEHLLAENKVEFIGEPIAVIVGDTYEAAKKAAHLIEIEYEELPPIVDPREAYEKGQLIIPPRIFSYGNTEKFWDACDVIVEGTVESGGQEHLYLETQGAIAIPKENSELKIYSSTQNPTAVQKVTARVLGLPMNKIEVDVKRLGGAFGGKEDQATPWGVMAALAAKKLNRPVKLILSRHDDLRMTGKRHPYISDYKLGLTSAGKIIAYEVTYYQNSGAAADLSTAILDRTLFHATNSYYVPNVKATGLCCKTNLPPNTAFRGFGGPQGMFVIEAAIYKAAEKLKIDPHKIQKLNLLHDYDIFYYGQRTENSQAIKCWNTAESIFDLPKLQASIQSFNSKSSQFKKGLAVMPICFGISFTSTFLNQASALVHIYTDGSVGISTGAIEMGQGVNKKLVNIAYKIFSINPDRIKIESTNTTRAANTSATAASSGADLNGNAVMIACKNLLDRLLFFVSGHLKSKCENIQIIDEVIYCDGKKSVLSWDKLINLAYMKRISLSSQAYYATPNIYFDNKINKGKPFAYHVYGTAIITSTVDCLRGTYEIDSVKVVHDFGESLDKIVDRGQAEGAIAQGIGWLTCEEIMHSEKGVLLSNSLSTYKVPDIYAAPKEIDVHFLENSTNHAGPFNSKAIGEPPFMYGIGAYFSILNALKAHKPNLEIEKISAPITPGKVLLTLQYYKKLQMD